MTPDEAYEEYQGAWVSYCASHTDMSGRYFQEMSKKMFVQVIIQVVRDERKRFELMVEKILPNCSNCDYDPQACSCFDLREEIIKEIKTGRL